MGALLAAAPIISHAVELGDYVTVNGKRYQIVAEPDPKDGPSYGEKEVSEAQAEAIVLANSGPGGEFEGYNEDWDLQWVPFDLGLGTLLGAGAIAAARKARSRRKLTKQAVA